MFYSPPQYFVTQKLHLDVQMGEHSVDRNVERTKDNLQILEGNLQHLISQMTYITKQQEYNRVTPEHFRALEKGSKIKQATFLGKVSK